MSTFSKLARGALARHRVPFTTLDGTEAECDVRPLVGSDEAIVLTEARKFALDRGVADPKDGNPIYEFGTWVHTIRLGCVDPESPPDAPLPFFDGGVSQILENLDPDRIAMLCEQQRCWQDACAPRPAGLGEDAFVAKVLQLATSAEGEDAPFAELRPALLRSFTRTLAGRFVTLVQLKSHSGSDSGSSSIALTTPATSGNS
jgi:hypothetical protein